MTESTPPPPDIDPEGKTLISKPDKTVVTPKRDRPGRPREIFENAGVFQAITPDQVAAAIKQRDNLKEPEAPIDPFTQWVSEQQEIEGGLGTAIKNLIDQGAEHNTTYSANVGFVVDRYQNSQEKKRVRLGLSKFDEGKMKNGLLVALDQKNDKGNDIKVVPYVTFGDMGQVVPNKSFVFDMSPEFYTKVLTTLTELGEK